MRTVYLLIIAPFLCLTAFTTADEPPSQLVDQRRTIETLRTQIADLQRSKNELARHFQREMNDLLKRQQSERADLLKQNAALETKLRKDLKAADASILRLERTVKEQQLVIQKLIAYIREHCSGAEVVVKGDGVTVKPGKAPNPPRPPHENPDTTVVRPRTASVLKSDGKVLIADATRGVLYVDLGSRDNLPVGLRFGVYPSRRHRVTDDDEPKAVVEVTHVGLTVSQCNVLGKAEPTLVAGDVLVSSVFDRGQRVRIFVYGDFDLDGDGKLDKLGSRRVRRMIQRWGGRPVAKIGPGTDFVVLGREPVLPKKPAADADMMVVYAYNLARDRLNAYNEQVAKARTLPIPILNQNRLLDLIGDAG